MTHSPGSTSKITTFVIAKDLAQRRIVGGLMQKRGVTRIREHVLPAEILADRCARLLDSAARKIAHWLEVECRSERIHFSLSDLTSFEFERRWRSQQPVLALAQ